MNDAHAAILDFKQNTISNPQLLRRLINYANWNVPVSERAAVDIMATHSAQAIQFHQADDGTKTLLLYTDSESYTAGFAGAPIPEQHFLTTTGEWVFQLPLSEFSQILINPNTPASMLFVGAQLDGLREFCEGVVVQDLLTQLRKGGGPDGSVRRVGNYRGFSIAVRQIDGRNTICFAPDDKQRSLIAIFTTDDAYDAYVNELPDTMTDSMFQVKMPGPDLFANLQQQPADGLVFNCCGPTQPVAFAFGLCSVIVDELNVVR